MSPFATMLLFCTLVIQLFGTSVLHNGVSAFTPRVLQSHVLSSGDIVDCIPLEDQPSLQQPYMKGHLLRNHKNLDEKKEFKKWLSFHHEVGSCPTGFIPILRHQPINSNAIEWSSLNNSSLPFNPNQKLFLIWNDGMIERTYGFVEGAAYQGAYAYLQQTKPYVYINSDASTASLWVMSEKCNNGTQVFEQYLETGFIVDPSNFNSDHSPRFYVRTMGNAQNKGQMCFNLQCGPFVQTSKSVVLGDVISTPSGDYNKFSISMQYEDPRANQSTWWLQVNDEDVGYWAMEGLDSSVLCLQEFASRIQWGGQKFGNTMGTTEIGTGAKGTAGYPSAAYISDMRYRLASVSNNAFVPAEGVVIQSGTHFPKFFDSMVVYHTRDSHTLDGTGLYYGGRRTNSTV